jgi:hypothetical protein
MEQLTVTAGGRGRILIAPTAKQSPGIPIWMSGSPLTRKEIASVAPILVKRAKLVKCSLAMTQFG